MSDYHREDELKRAQKSIERVNRKLREMCEFVNQQILRAAKAAGISADELLELADDELAQLSGQPQAWCKAWREWRRNGAGA